MSEIRTLIIDDEPLAREGIRAFLQQDQELKIVGECTNGLEAVAAINNAKPDLVFLDIQMPEMDGFEVLEHLGEGNLPLIIFVTAYDRYAIKAFERHALDYLLKPVDEERFQKALQRAKAQLQKEKAGTFGEQLMALMHEHQGNWPEIPKTERSQETEYVQRLVIKTAGRINFLLVDEIDWIEAADQYVLLHLGNETHLMRESMQSLEGRLDPARFLRIHRSTMVNVDRVKELQPFHKGDYTVILSKGTRLKLSRNRRDKLKQLCGGSL